MAKKRARNEYVSIDQVFEVIKSRDFLQNLYQDLIKDIEEKPTYQQLKRMVTAVVDNSIEEISADSVTQLQAVQRARILQNISIMAYTVDKAVFEGLYKKLENNFQSLVKTMVEEAQKERQSEQNKIMVSENSFNCSSHDMFENIEELLHEQSSTIKTDSSLAKSLKEEEDDSSDVSSVGTSDLSSFEDAISLGSDDCDDEQGKCYLSLKEANHLYTNGQLSSIFELQKRAAESAKISKEKGTAICYRDEPRPQRSRKPNRKYSSEDERPESHVSPHLPKSLSTTPQKTSSPLLTARKSVNSPGIKIPAAMKQRKLAVVISPLRGLESPNKRQRGSSSSSVKNSPKRYSSSDLYKPRSNFRSCRAVQKM